MSSFRAFVAELENDPEQKAALDAARAMLRDDDPPMAGAREPRRPTPLAPATSEAVAGHWERDDYGYWFIPEGPDERS